jgi:hypothetical protein
MSDITMHATDSELFQKLQKERVSRSILTVKT